MCIRDRYDSYSFPSAKHWLGTDKYGMDMLTRLMYGLSLIHISETQIRAEEHYIEKQRAALALEEQHSSGRRLLRDIKEGFRYLQIGRAPV